VVGHRVDREIAAAGSFARGNRRIEGRQKIAMMRSGFAVASRNAEIVPFELYDAERFSDQIDPAVSRKELRQAIVGDTVDFDIYVLRVMTEQRVANRAADDQRTKSGYAKVANYGFEGRR